MDNPYQYYEYDENCQTQDSNRPDNRAAALFNDSNDKPRNWQGAGWQTDTVQPESRISDFQADFHQQDRHWGHSDRMNQQWSNEPETGSFETRRQGSGFRGGMRQMRGRRARGRGFGYRNHPDNSGRGGHHHPQDQHYFDDNSYQNCHPSYHPPPGGADFESRAHGRIDDGYGRGWNDPREMHSQNMEYRQGNYPSGPGQHFDGGRGQQFGRGSGRPYSNRHTATASQGSWVSDKEPDQSCNQGPDQTLNKRENQSTSEEPCDKTGATETDSSKGEERIELNSDKSEPSQDAKPVETGTENRKVSGDPVALQQDIPPASGQHEPGGEANSNTQITVPQDPEAAHISQPAHSSTVQAGEPEETQVAKTGSMTSKQQPSEDKQELTGPVPSISTAVDMEESDDEGDTSFCKLCNMSFDSNEKYFRHTRGLLHTQRQMAKEEQEKSGVKAWQSEHISNTQAPKPPHYGKDAWHQSSQFESHRPEAKAGGTVWNWPQGQGGEQQWKYEGDGQKNLKENNDPAVAGGGGSDMASVQTCLAASTSQGLALISGSGDEEEDWENEEDWEEEVTKGAADKDQNEEFHCDLCDIQTTGFVNMRAHLNGRIHKTVQENLDKGIPVPRRLLVKLGPKAQTCKPTVPVIAVETKHGVRPSILMELLKAIPEAVVGVKCIREFQIGRQPSFLCTVCERTCDSASIQTHLMGSKHRMKYLSEYNPDIYEHVKKHGGKKSQLSAFLEQVCTDVEKKEGRGEPTVEQPLIEPSAEKFLKKAEKKPKSEEKPEEKSAKSEDAAESTKETGSEAKPDSSKRKLPHEVVVAMYKESKKRQEELDQEKDPQEGYRHGKEWQREGYEHERGDPPEDTRRRGGPPRDSRRGRGMPPDYFGRGRGGPPDYFGRGRGGPPDYFGRGRRPPPEDFWHGREGPPDDFERRRGWYPEDMRHGGGWPPEGYDHGRGQPPVDKYEHERGRPMDPYRRFKDSEFEYRPEFGEGLDDRYLPPPFRDPRSVEEERRHMMYAYEKHNFYYPPIGVSSHEARRLMFMEYEQLGLPYEQACSRVLIQEERRMKLMELLRDGFPLAEAQQKVLTAENRHLLIREYEEQGLSPTEARWRVVVEEERMKLFEDYEQRGYTPLEARAHITCGRHRMHLIHEYERHGMPPDEARHRALAEEDHFKAIESGSSIGSHSDLDSIADKRMLMMHLEQGMSQEEAENKVIVYLRQQGVTTQDAILRVKKIQLEIPVKSSRGEVQDSKHDENIDGGSSRDPDNVSRDVGKGVTTPVTTPVREEQRSSSRDQYDKPSSSTRVDFPAKYSEYDNISPEEAKERLLREYEKRGIPREEARSALIAELIRSGVSEGEARRRFAEPSTSASKTSKEHSHSSRRREGWRGDHDFSPLLRPTPRERRSRSPVPRAYRMDMQKEDRILYDRDRGRENRTRGGRDPADSRDRRRGPDRRDETTAELSIRGRHVHSEDRDRSRRGGSIEIVSKDDSRYLESSARPTLTLGEELRLKKLKRSSGIELPGQTPAKQAKETAATSTSSSSRTVANTARIRPEPSGIQDVPGLLETLTNNLISNEDDAAMALQVSKALTSALLKYQIKAVPEDEVEQPASQSKSSFVERRIEDAKKLFETKMQTKESLQLPSIRSKQGHPGGKESKTTESLQTQQQTQEGRIKFGFFASRSQPAKNISLSSITVPQEGTSQQRSESRKWMREAVFPDEEEEDLEEGKSHRSSRQVIEWGARDRKIISPSTHSTKGRPSSSRRYN